MDRDQKRARYDRIRGQLSGLLGKTADMQARMATVVALLYHKLDHYFWCGFYRLLDGNLVVGPYQGPLACQVLARERGVCWAAVQRRETVIVPDVRLFPGHIACDSRSLSEIVVPVRDASGAVVAVLDVDSDKMEQFDDMDREGLEAIVALLSR